MVEKVFSCQVCGKAYSAATPDDLRTIATLEETKGSIKREYECEDGHKNVIYWR